MARPPCPVRRAATAAACSSTRTRTPPAPAAAARSGSPRAKASSLSAVIPKRYRERLLRPRRRSIDLPATPSRAIRALRRRPRTRTSTQGRGLWLIGDVGTGKTSLAMLVSKAALDAGPHGRDLLDAAPAARDPHRPTATTRRPPTSRCSTAWRPSTCCTSTTSAPSTRPSGCSSSSTRSSTPATRSEQAIARSRRTSSVDELARADRRAHVSRLVEMCRADPALRQRRSAIPA